MKIVASGCSGMVGSCLLTELADRGHEVTQLVRSSPKAGERLWNPISGVLDMDVFRDCDGVIHLGGDNIAEGRWNPAKKKRIRESRIDSTALLAKKMARAPTPPKFFLCASAIGFYGNRGDEIMTENCMPGDDFLANVCQQWEAASQPASDAGIRVINTRIGVVLATQGGALAKMLTPFGNLE